MEQDARIQTERTLGQYDARFIALEQDLAEIREEGRAANRAILEEMRRSFDAIKREFEEVRPGATDYFKLVGTAAAAMTVGMTMMSVVGGLALQPVAIVSNQNAENHAALEEQLNFHHVEVAAVNARQTTELEWLSWLAKDGLPRGIANSTAVGERERQSMRDLFGMKQDATDQDIAELQSQIKELREKL